VVCKLVVVNDYVVCGSFCVEPMHSASPHLLRRQTVMDSMINRRLPCCLVTTLSVVVCTSAAPSSSQWSTGNETLIRSRLNWR
jgi:hypothetical protein